MKKLLLFSWLSCSLNATAQIPDSTFGVNALTTTNFNGGHDGYNSVVALPNGKIIAAGFAKNAGGKTECAIARYNINGTLDVGFNGTGKVTVPATDQETLKKLIVQPDGKLLAIGSRYTSNTEYSILLMRFDSTGILDNTFGSNGIVVLGATGSKYDGNNLALQSDGKIVIAGSKLYDKFILARFNTNGTPDNSFGTNGIVMSCYDAAEAVGSEGIGLGIQPDGKILICGAAWANTPAIGIARYSATGTIDNTFGTGGSGRLILVSPFGSTAPEVWGAEDMAILPDGKILMPAILSTPTTAHMPCIVRVHNNGTKDNSFGIAGFARPAYSNFYEMIHKLTLQTDGKILAAGYAQGSTASSGDSLVMLCFDTSGVPSASFGNNGRVTLKRVQQGTRAKGIALQSDGKILLAGSQGPYNSQTNMVMRFKYAAQAPNNVSTTDDNGERIHIYPNPATDRLMVSLPVRWSEKNLILCITNTLGQTVLQKPVSNLREVSIDVSGLSKGYYVLSVRHNNAQLLQRTFLRE
jgi:uncharacterized delta-60 repeat protein